MILHLPTGLHQDELLYSALARSGDMVTPPALRDLLGTAFGATTMVATIDLPTRLDTVGSKLLCLRGAAEPGLVLLREHTLFPYYAPVVEPAVAERAATLMRAGAGGVVHGLLGVRASRVPTVARLRYCPGCVAGDRGEHGFAWWRRTHQLPGVLVCPKHTVSLHASQRRVSSARDRLAFHSLERSLQITDEPCIGGAIGAAKLGILLDVAKESSALLAGCSEALPGVGPNALWRSREIALRQAGFGRGSQQIALAPVRAALVEAFGKDLLAIMGCPTGADGADDWVSRMVRPPRRSAHPLYHVVIATLLRQLEGVHLGLGGSARLAPPSTAPSVPKGDQGLGAAGGTVWSASLVSLVTSTNTSLRGIARELNVDPITVQRHAHKLGVWRKEWSVRARVLPATAAAVKSTAALAGARQRWLALGSLRPRLSRKEMRSRDPAAHALLYRRDRDWLTLHSPPRLPPKRTRSGVDWAARDAEVAAELHAAADRLALIHSRRRAIRPATIAREADRLSLLQQHSARMPLASRVLVRRAEDPVFLAATRLERVVAERAAEGLPPPAVSVLARAAGLNRKRSGQLRAALAAALACLGRPGY